MTFGHRFGDLIHYTPAQTRAFLRAIAKNEVERLAADAICARAAQADGKGFKSFMESLRSE